MNCSTFAGYTVMKNANATENLVTLNFYEEKVFSFFFSPHKVHNFLSRSEGLEVDQRT